MYWTSPRTPCSGPKSAASVTPGAAWRRSARCRNCASTLVGLTMAPTRSPRSARNCSASHTSSPVFTRMARSVPRPPPGSMTGGAESAHRLLLRLERLEKCGGLLRSPGAPVEVGERPGDDRVLGLRLVEVGEGSLRLRHLPRLLLHAAKLELETGVPVPRADEVRQLLLRLGPVAGPLGQRGESPVRVHVVAPERDGLSLRLACAIDVSPLLLQEAPEVEATRVVRRERVGPAEVPVHHLQPGAQVEPEPRRLEMAVRGPGLVL